MPQMFGSLRDTVYKDNVGESVALRECKMVMGEGCTGDGWRNSSITIIRDHNGDFYNSWESEGRKKVLNECFGKAVTAVRSVRQNQVEHQQAIAGFANILPTAWVKGDEGYDNKLYVASGYRTADEAIEAAVKGYVSQPHANAKLTHGRGMDLSKPIALTATTATSENSSNRAKEAAQAGCKKFKAKSCILQAQYDSRTSGLFVHDYGPTKAP